MRVTRKAWCSRTSIPEKSRSRWAAISCSRGTNVDRAIAPSVTLSRTATKRGSSGGTFTRAKRRCPVLGSATITARFSERLEM